MENLLKKQMKISARIEAFIANTNKAGKEALTRKYLCNRIDLLKDYWGQFQSNDASLTSHSHEDTPYSKDDVYDSTESSYMMVLSTLQEMVAKTPPESTSSSSQSTGRGQLPPITLPKFTGNFNDWISFRELFDAMVHKNASLSTIEKFHYLKAALEGDAQQPIKNLAVTADNYDGAWELLRQRYENKRRQVYHYLLNLLKRPSVNSNNPKQLRKLLDSTNEAIQGLTSLNRPVDKWDDWFVITTLQLLDATIHKDWETHLDDFTDLPTFKTLSLFLEGRLRAWETLAPFQSSISIKSINQSKHSPNAHNKGNLSNYHASRSANNKIVCVLCKAPHFIAYCPSFREKSIEQRMIEVQRQKICENCLSNTHTITECNSKKKCLLCGQQHHTLLHKTEPSPITRSSELAPSVSQEPSTSGSTVLTARHHKTKSVLLATVLVPVAAADGSIHYVRALLDQGSEANFISKRMVTKLGLPRRPSSQSFNGVGNQHLLEAQAITTISIQSYSIGFSLDFDAFILETVTTNSLSLPINLLPTEFQCLILADPVDDNPRPIDMLLGVEIYAAILRNGFQQDTSSNLVAQQTVFGWIISGSLSTSSNNQLNCYNTLLVDHTLHELVKRFWTLEEPPTFDTITPEEQQCEQFYQNTYARLPSGRFQVRLPFKGTNPPTLGNSYHDALKQFRALERRFKTNPLFQQKYQDFIAEYLALGHMSLLTTPPDQCHYYLPHHGVFKTNDPLSSIRVVFNASQVTSNGTSLNDNLLSGSALQVDLRKIIIRWRLFRYVFTCDIVKMYRQIMIHPDDRAYQLILWRDPGGALLTYQLKTVTYGMSSSPYLAIRCLQQLARDGQEQYPNASHCLLKSTYVDDILAGSHDPQNALALKIDLINLLQSGGFELSKWSTNYPPLVKETTTESFAVELDIPIKTLGILWLPQSDVFTYQLHASTTEAPVTKRAVLSLIARLYDPLGWIAPILITGKIILQSLWKSGINWDDPLPPPALARWLDFKNALENLSLILIPRWYHSPAITNAELHAFCDSSEHAYAAALYLRVETSTINANLILAKARVTPLKTQTIPRLELCGAVLASKLVKDVCSFLPNLNINVYLWTDSKITLAWISSSPSRWTTFIANRVALIHTLLPNAYFGYVKGAENPSDLATRGTNPSHLMSNPLWLHGPFWLQEPKEKWRENPELFTTTLEERPLKIQAILPQPEFDLLSRYSSLSKLKRITALCFRFCYNSKHAKQERKTDAPSPEDIELGFTALIKLAQKQVYHEELQSLLRTATVRVSSQITSLSPFIDAGGLLRVGGRLHNSTLPYNERHPIILPPRSPLTMLIIKEAHLLTLHGGAQLTTNFLRLKYWIPRSRNSIRQVIHRCIICFRSRPKLSRQLMGNLPEIRVKPSRPFLRSGVDYAGPFYMTPSKGRGIKSIKGYIAVFICLVTHAIHLELVTDLSSNAFLAAFRRFTSRRGRCANLYSDNSTTFHGANHALQLVFDQGLRDWQALAPQLALEGTKWTFIPPSAPHMGGIWEAAVKAVKHHLVRVVGDTKLTYEELFTVLAQIEAALNSRPLTPLSEDVSDATALTPGHFLVGESLLQPPSLPYVSASLSITDRWQRVQEIVGQTWERWSAEYLRYLQRRTKWQRPDHNLNIGDLVLIQDERYPLGKWPLARITNVHPGGDNLTRVVTVKLASGRELRRPIHKLAALPNTY